MLTKSCTRGCGTRKAGGTYLCCGQSPNGLPIEYFVLDPVRLWATEWHRGFRIIKGKNCNHVVIFVSDSDYLSPWCFVEEVRRFGASRKVAPTFPFEQLTPGLSRMLFAHKKAYIIPDLWPMLEAERDAPLDDHCSFYHSSGWAKTLPGWHPKVEKLTACTFVHKDLAWWIHREFGTANYATDENEQDIYSIKMPGFTFNGVIPIVGNDIHEKPELLDDYLMAGVFLSLPLTHVEYPHYENKKSASKAKDAGYQTFVMDY